MCKKHGRRARRYDDHPTRPLAAITRALATEPRLYRLAAQAIRCTHNKDAAASYLLATLTAAGIDQTADGFHFTRAGIRYALRYI